MIDLEKVFIHGRYYYNDNKLYLYNTATGIEFNFRGKMASLSLQAKNGQSCQAWMRVIIDNDDKNARELKFGAQNAEFMLFQAKNEEIHNIKVLKVSEAIESHVIINDLVIDGIFLDKPVYQNDLLVIGDSTVSAFGNLGKCDDEKTLFDTDGLQGFAYLVAKHFNLSPNILSGSGWGLTFSPWTTPNRRPMLKYIDKVAVIEEIPYDLTKINPKVILISLGCNDSHYYTYTGEAGKTNSELLEEFQNDYHKLLTMLNKLYPNVPIIMIYGVMREAHNYKPMHDLFLKEKDSFNLYEALLEGDISGVSTHPTKFSHIEIADKLIKMIEGIINE